MDIPTTAELVRARIRSLMHKNGWNETETARRLRFIHTRWNQPRFHRMMSGEQDFSLNMGDFDDIAKLFAMPVVELFRDAFGQFDRRSNTDRRSGTDRRQADQAVYSPVEKEHWGEMFTAKKKSG